MVLKMSSRPGDSPQRSDCQLLSSDLGLVMVWPSDDPTGYGPIVEGSGLMKTLAYDLIASDHADPERTVFLLHGILGSRRNWGTLGRRLSEAHPGRRFVLVDLRGHGDSHGQGTPDTVEACARDLVHLAQTLECHPETVIGHSFGGKVALAYGRLRPKGLRHLWSLDSPPDSDAVASAISVTSVIETARTAPIPFSHRLAAVPHFEANGFDRSVAAWMTTNLKRTEDGFVWRFNLDVVSALLEDYVRTSMWSFLEDPERTVHVHFLLAARSHWWRGPVESRLMDLDRSFTHILEDAGHWVHMDDPDGLLAALATTLTDP